MTAEAGNGPPAPAPAAQPAPLPAPEEQPASLPAPAEQPTPLPAPGFAEVRIVASTPETARRIAEVLRLRFAADEQRSYPAGDDGAGTRLHLTVDTVHVPEAHGPSRLRLVTGPPHADEV